MSSSVRVATTAVMSVTLCLSAVACSSSPASKSASSSTTPHSSTSSATTTARATSSTAIPTGEAALGITSSNPSPAPSMGEGPIALKDGAGNAELTGLSPRQSYVILMACAGGRELRVLDNHGTKAAGINPGCAPGGMYSFNLTPARDMITPSGHLKIYAPATTHWTVGLWKHA